MKKILVVDDFSSVRLYHCNLIRHLGYEAFPAESLSEARQLLSKQKIDLILLDLLMPEEDGRGLFENKGTSKIPPTIIITSESEQYGASYLSKLKANSVLTKPVQPQTLQEAIKAIFSGSN